MIEADLAIKDRLLISVEKTNVKRKRTQNLKMKPTPQDNLLLRKF